MNPDLNATAMAIAGTIIDPSTDPRTVLTLLGAMRDTMQVGAVAIAIAATEEQDKDSDKKIFQGPQTPADILRMLADSWEEQVSEEDWENQIITFRNFEGNFQAEELTKDMPETLTVNDILGEENAKEKE